MNLKRNKLDEQAIEASMAPDAGFSRNEWKLPQGLIEASIGHRMFLIGYIA
ncbi:MAG: hypothetical protein RIG68_20365 [Imperialibacter sp.]|uniref:hypothetical protein n=1 Tax=Imperialibacter sp. TaxID=2038411 RepID=UPI0032F05082